ncbi:MAG: toll/interleukin-1 receptor domain-containing protein [Bryobacteraceae bacterium]
MKVFLSWSGDRSKAIADVLRRWLPGVLQAVRPYFSPDDVAKGTRWSSEIAKELDASRVGILVITPDNQEAAWLLFEAGALAKNLDRSKVCPLLFGGMEPTDVKGPLVQFEAAKFSKDEMKRVMKMINGELAEAGLASDVLDTVFEMWWSKLDTDVAGQLENVTETVQGTRRSERDLLEEVLSLTRRLASDRIGIIPSAHPAWNDLFISIVELAKTAYRRSPDADTAKVIQGCLRPLSYIARRDVRARGQSLFREGLVKVLDELRNVLPPDADEIRVEQSQEE